MSFQIQSFIASETDLIGQYAAGSGRLLVRLFSGVLDLFIGGTSSSSIAISTDTIHELTLSRVGSVFTLGVDGEEVTLNFAGSLDDEILVLGAQKPLSPPNIFDGDIYEEAIFEINGSR